MQHQASKETEANRLQAKEGGNAAMMDTIRTCDICGKKFETRIPSKKTCSSGCGYKLRGRTQAAYYKEWYRRKKMAEASQ